MTKIINLLNFIKDKKGHDLPSKAKIIHHFDELSRAQQESEIRTDPTIVTFMDNPPEWAQLLAVKIYTGAFRGLIKKNPDLSERVKLEAVKTFASNLKYIKNPSKGLIITAIHKDPTAIRYVWNPSESLQMYAVRRDPRAIQGIMHATPAVLQLYGELVRNKHDTFYNIK